MCRSLDLLADGGHLGFISPMALLGDDQAADLRRRIIDAARFTAVDAFPQKDNPKERVFPEAKLSTAVFVLEKRRPSDRTSKPFVSRVHPGREIVGTSPSLTLTTEAIPLYDPSNFSIVSCSQDDWDLATRVTSSGRMIRLREVVEFFQGEVNETNERAKGNLSGPGDGKLVTRGASVTLYVVRKASQGKDLWLNIAKFLKGKGPDTKALHYLGPRVGLQESSPQNNFRRIIAAYILAGEFCNHKVNYVPEKCSGLPLPFLLALLNSKLADWYFRLGSTNAAVSHYQLYNLPCPLFSNSSSASDRGLAHRALKALDARDTEGVLSMLAPALASGAPFSRSVLDIVVAAVEKITEIEKGRGDIPKSERSHLAPESQVHQDLIDRLLFRMAGLSEGEGRGLETRLAEML
ncbi:MAG: hypothetical protein ACREDR_14050 [Blastocatellia bacterium]